MVVQTKKFLSLVQFTCRKYMLVDSREYFPIFKGIGIIWWGARGQLFSLIINSKESVFLGFTLLVFCFTQTARPRIYLRLRCMFKIRVTDRINTQHRQRKVLPSVVCGWLLLIKPYLTASVICPYVCCHLVPFVIDIFMWRHLVSSSVIHF